MITFFYYFFYFSSNAHYIGNIVITRIVILGFQHFFFLRAARSAYNWGGEGGGEASFKSRGSLQAAVYSRRKT